MKFLSKLILKLMGWKIVGGVPEGLTKAVVIVAPHTSNWDFFIGRMGYYVLGLKAKFLIKKEIFVFPFKTILLKMGGIPIERSKKTNSVETVAALFQKYDNLCITVAPEGTRKLNPNWKKGFYYIALRAKVPILLGVIDYKKKEAGLGPMVYPSGDFEKDFKFIEDFYRPLNGKYPELFSLSEEGQRILNEKKKTENP
ncbi:MAG: glycerol acyltransferase [Chlorobi bacterium]|nr:glycerol acyltransferase [Chlorobiota bacterium]